VCEVSVSEVCVKCVLEMCVCVRDACVSVC